VSSEAKVLAVRGIAGMERRKIRSSSSLDSCSSFYRIISSLNRLSMQSSQSYICWWPKVIEKDSRLEWIDQIRFTSAKEGNGADMADGVLHGQLWYTWDLQ
jgi:hypothetical protein